MTLPRALRSACGLFCLVTASCAEVSYWNPASSHDELLRTRERAVRGAEIEVRAWQAQSELRVQARWRCELVEWNEVRRTTVEEPEVDVAGDVVLLALSTIPTGFGVALLADSGNVYDNDRNGREYNPAGPTGAITGGVMLLTLGTALMVVPAVDLILASASVESEEIVEEPGRRLRRSVPCPEPEPAAGVAVDGVLRAVGMAEGTTIVLGTTDELGRLVVDLGRVLSPEDVARLEPGTTLEVRVGNEVAGRADLSAVRLALAARLRELEAGAWSAADADACLRAPSEQSCHGVRAYLERHPDGVHAAQARAAIDALTTTTTMVQVQAEPTPDDDATAKARDEVQSTCARACTKACQRRATCIERCVEEVCP